MTNSTYKSKYIAVSEASKEAAWLKNFIRDLGVIPTTHEPIELFCDRSKLIDRKYHYI